MKNFIVVGGGKKIVQALTDNGLTNVNNSISLTRTLSTPI